VKVRIAFVDQKTIRINDEQYRLYSTVDPENEQNPSFTSVSE